MTDIDAASRLHLQVTMNTQLFVDQNCIHITGELNFSTVVNVWEQSLLFLPTLQSIVINFSRVTATNSAGLALLVEWKKYALSHNKNCVFVNLPSQLTNLANLCGLNLK